MKQKITFINPVKLKSHEMTDNRRLLIVMQKIKADGFIRNPVVVERKNLVILDGHHRVEVLKRLGAKKVPVFFVDYKDKNVRVYLRRKEFKAENIKEKVIKMGLSNSVFPSKTTRHLIGSRSIKININLNKLFAK